MDKDKSKALELTARGLAPLLTSLLFWVVWNAFTDTDHPLRYTYILVTMYVTYAVLWMVEFLAWMAT